MISSQMLMDAPAGYSSGSFDYLGGMAHLAVYPAPITADRIMAHYQDVLRGGVAY